jgi:hypothetical protein
VAAQAAVKVAAAQEAVKVVEKAVEVDGNPRGAAHRELPLCGSHHFDRSH